MSACPRCGTIPPAEARFCASCGLALGGAAAREERRIVTVLFGDLVEFTALSEARDPEVIKRIIDRAFEGLAETVTVYGGRVDKILGDEIMAVFGAPQAHEDDPERAVRCALEMQRSLDTYSQDLQRERGFSLAMRIGINTGEVVAGSIGGADSYTVVGDAVNVASRLVKSARPGTILAGPATRAATERAIEYRPIEPLVVKGKTDAIHAAEVVGERLAAVRSRTPRSTPLVGRDHELALLDSLAAIVARDRRPAVVTILGEAGMGKTRLAEEFASRLHGARVLWGRSLPYGTASPSFAVEEMIRAAFDVLPTDEPVAARKKIADKLAACGLGGETERVVALAGVRDQPAISAAAALARRGGGSGGGGAGPAAGAIPRGGDIAAAVTVFEMLASREDRLLVLVFQELHWAEQPLIELIGEMVGRVRSAPVLVIALGRTELAERCESWPASAGNTMLHLTPLPREAASELLDALAGDRAGALPPALRESVLDRAGGNPFFIEEFVRLVLESGEPGGVVPAGVHALVAARIDTLEPSVRRVARDAAVAGEQFWADALVADDPAEVEAALAELREREMIEPVDQPSIPGHDEYRFRQTIVREVAYAALPKQSRAERHAAVARWLERVTADAGSEHEHVALVAHHWEQAALNARDVGSPAGEYERKAGAYLERAGDEAMGKDIATAAASFYVRALPFASGEAELQLRVRLAEAFVGAWQPIRAQEHLEHALDDARRLGDRRSEGKALRLLGDLCRMRGEPEAAREHLERALAIAREVGDVVEEAENLRSHGLLDLLTGRVPAAPLWFRQALARYREVGDKRGEGWALQNLGWASVMLGRADEAIEILDEGARVFGELEDVEGVGWCLGLRSWALLFLGKFDEADELARMLIDAVDVVQANALGMGGMGVAIERVLRAYVAVSRMQADEAVEMATATFRHFDEMESEWGQAMARFPIGMAQIQGMRLDAARETMTEAVRFAREASDPLIEALTLSILAYIELEAGDLERAETLSEQARRATQDAGVEWQSDVSRHWLRGEIAKRRGRLDDAVETLEAAQDAPAGIMPRARATVVLAEVLRDQGDFARSVQVAREAYEQAAQSPMDAVRALRAAAAALLDGGDPLGAIAETDRALAMLDRGRWDAERIRVLTVKSRALDEAGLHDEAAEAHEAARALLDAFPPDADTRSLAALLAR